MITASLGKSEIDGERILLTVWPSKAGELDDGTFDVGVWEESQTHVCMARGADPKVAWKAAYQGVRRIARKAGGFDWCPDGRDEENCPFPDREKQKFSLIKKLLPIPERMLIDKGMAFRSRMMMPVHITIEGVFSPKTTEAEAWLTEVLNHSISQFQIEDVEISVRVGQGSEQLPSDCGQSQQAVFPDSSFS